MRSIIIILEVFAYFFKALAWSLLGFLFGNIEQYSPKMVMFILLTSVALWIIGYVFSKFEWKQEGKEDKIISFRDCSALRWIGAVLVLIALMGSSQLEQAEKAIGIFLYPGIYLIVAGYLREHKYDKLIKSKSSCK